MAPRNLFRSVLAILVIGAAVALAAAAVAQTAAALSFRCVDSFGKRGGSLGQFQSPQGVAVGPGGAVYVVDDSEETLQRFSAGGRALSRSDLSRIGDLSFPDWVAVDGQGRIFVSSSFDGVKRFRFVSNRLRFDATVVADDSKDYDVFAPAGVALDTADARLLVVDGTGFLYAFTCDGALIGAWPKVWDGDGTVGMANPRGVAVGPDGSLFVTAAGELGKNIDPCVWKSNGALTPVTTWGGRGTANGRFRMSGNDGIACDAQGRVYVVDGKNQRVQVFDADGKFLAKFGSRGSRGLGHFLEPTGIAVAPNGRVYVADAGRDIIQVFVPR